MCWLLRERPRPIEACLATGITNAASEGNNRLIKLEARNAFGFRNRANQSLRSRCATTCRSRREAHTHELRRSGVPKYWWSGSQSPLSSLSHSRSR
ncbi:transposase [Nocardiopsis oceani]